MQSADRQSLSSASRLVIKLGSNLVADERGEPNRELLAALVGEIAGLVRSGKQIILITSGAVRVGLTRMGVSARSDRLPARQAAAAIGQAELISCYRELFATHGLGAAQILLTSADITDFRRYLHLRNTLSALLRKPGVIPVLNENDPVSVEGLQIGENDRLAALVAAKVDADLLVLLSDVEGFLTGDPRLDSSARLIPTVTELTPEMEELAHDASSGIGTGGMRTKLQAAHVTMGSGLWMVIADGRVPRVLERLLAGEEIGTLFQPRPWRMRSRKRWIGFASNPKGSLTVDEGAVKAMIERGSSLLPVGVQAVDGAFDQGDAVSVLDPSGREVARGLVNYDSAEVRRIVRCHTNEIAQRLGHHPYDEVIHRDNLVLV